MEPAARGCDRGPQGGRPPPARGRGQPPQGGQEGEDSVGLGPDPEPGGQEGRHPTPPRLALPDPDEPRHYAEVLESIIPGWDADANAQEEDRLGIQRSRRWIKEKKTTRSR